MFCTGTQYSTDVRNTKQADETHRTSSDNGSQRQETDMDIHHSLRIGMILVIRYNLILILFPFNADEPQNDKGNEGEAERQNSTMSRPRRERKMPSNLKDMVLYNIYS